MPLPLPHGYLSQNDVRENFERLAEQFPIGPANLLAGSGTTFPTTPLNGQDYFYEVDTSITWHFRYRSATGKWHFVGGPPLYAEITAAETTTSNTFVALTTAGPSITLPLTGDYDVTIGMRGYNDTSGSGADMSYDIGGTAASTNDMVTSVVNNADTGAFNTMRPRRKTGLTAVTLTSKYRRATAAGTATIGSRWISATPVLAP